MVVEVATVKVFEIEEKKPELLAAWPGGPAACAARSSGFFSATSKSLTVATDVSSEHSARLLESDNGIKKTSLSFWLRKGDAYSYRSLSQNFFGVIRLYREQAIGSRPSWPIARKVGETTFTPLVGWALYPLS